MSERAPRLYGSWVHVVDRNGREHLEERWLEPAPAEASTRSTGSQQAA